MKKLKTFIIGFLIWLYILAFIYLACAIAQANFNFTEWDEVARKGLAWLWGLFGLVGFFALIIITFDFID